MNPAIRRVISNMESHGCTVKVFHSRRKRNDSILPNGGATTVEIRVPAHTIRDLPEIIEGAPDLVVVGGTKCSKSDSFCKDTGANIAFARAMKHLTSIVARSTMKRLVAPPAVAVVNPVTGIELVKVSH